MWVRYPEGQRVEIREPTVTENINVIFDTPRGVLEHAEIVEPVCNVLRHGDQRSYPGLTGVCDHGNAKLILICL